MLAEFEAIGVLKARYCRFLDRKLWPQFEELFTKDCTFIIDSADLREMGEAPRMKLDRRDFVVMVRQILEVGSTSVHHVHSPELSLDNPTTASGLWAMEDYVVSSLRSFRGYGHYQETYRKVDGTWGISEWRLDRLRIDPLSN